jgi:4-amino-4-deoxy-L-arabinose transferase-like glycosyltransferase
MSARRWPSPDRAALLLALLGMLLALPVLLYPLGRDQGAYANIAQAIRAGGLPYIDMWDIKPPMIYYIYALGFSVFGATPLAVRALDVLFVPLALPALYALTRGAGGRAAARWAMLLFPVFYFTETFASLSQSDSLVLLPMMWAAWAILRAGQARRASAQALRFAAMGGALCAVVLLFKHYYVMFALALALDHALHRRALPWREGVAFGVGGLLVGLPALAYFVHTGIWHEMLIVAQGTAGYNAQSFESVGAFVGQMLHYLAFRWAHWGVLLMLCAAALVRPRWAGRAGWIGWWLAAGLGFVLIQGKGFDTHWLPLLPPLVVLGGIGLARVLEALPAARIRLAARVLAVVGLGLLLAKDTWLPAWPYLTGQHSLRAYYTRFQAGDLQAAESLRMARWLQERLPAGETVYIWGFRPEVAFMAGLRPATRFQMQFPLVGDRYPEQWKTENVDTLWAALPPIVIVMRADYMPWVTGVEDDSNTVLANDYPALRDWLIYNYDRGEERGNFLIWIRKGG